MARFTPHSRAVVAQKRECSRNNFPKCQKLSWCIKSTIFVQCDIGKGQDRLIGSIRHDCLDHVIVLGEGHLRRILKSYFDYYLQSRTHLSLTKDAPVSRSVQPPEIGEVIESPQVGGLHHRYDRHAA